MERVLNIKGIEIKVYLDDEGQCYYAEFDKDGKHNKYTLSSYNGEYVESLYSILFPEYANLLMKTIFCKEMTMEEWSKFVEYHDEIDKIYEEIKKSGST